MLRRVTLVRTDGSEELSASSIIRVTRIGELGSTVDESIFSIFRCIPLFLLYYINIFRFNDHNQVNKMWDYGIYCSFMLV
jgi:hypothetical protein